MISEALRRCFEDERILYAIVANVATGEMDEYGDSKPFNASNEPWSFRNRYFGNPDIVKSLDRSLEGQIMPQGWRRGSLGCILMKPSPDVLMGIFGIDEDTIRFMLWGEEIAPRMIAAWKGDQEPGSSG